MKRNHWRQRLSLMKRIEFSSFFEFFHFQLFPIPVGNCLGTALDLFHLSWPLCSFPLTEWVIVPLPIALLLAWNVFAIEWNRTRRKRCNHIFITQKVAIQKQWEDSVVINWRCSSILIYLQKVQHLSPTNIFYDSLQELTEPFCDLICSERKKRSRRNEGVWN